MDMTPFAAGNTFEWDPNYNNWFHPFTREPYELYLMPENPRDYTGPEMLELAMKSHEKCRFHFAQYQLQSYLLRLVITPGEYRPDLIYLDHDRFDHGISATFMPSRIAELVTASAGLYGNELDAWKDPAASEPSCPELHVRMRQCYEYYNRFMCICPKRDAQLLVYVFGPAVTQAFCDLFRLQSIFNAHRTPGSYLPFLPLEMWDTIGEFILRRDWYNKTLNLTRTSRARNIYNSASELLLTAILNPKRLFGAICR